MIRLSSKSIQSDNNQRLGLSILMPTFCRYEKLYRNLIYVHKVFSHRSLSPLEYELEIIIADGSPHDYNQIHKRKCIAITQSLKHELGLNISMHLLENHSYLSRLNFLLEKSNSPFIALLGDEDLMVFDNIATKLDRMFNDKSISSISGKYVDITGFEKSGRRLRCLSRDGWIYGVKIESESVLDRLCQYFILKVAGLSGMSYSILRRDVFSCYLNFLNSFDPSEITLCGSEYALHLITIASGNLISDSEPSYLRDHTFLSDHSSNESLNGAEIWSESRKDKILFKKSFEYIYKHFNLPNDFANICQIAESCWRNYPYMIDCRKKIGVLVNSDHKSIYSEVASSVSNITLQAAKYAWKVTAKDCFRSIGGTKAIGLHPYFLKRYF